MRPGMRQILTALAPTLLVITAINLACGQADPTPGHLPTGVITKTSSTSTPAALPTQKEQTTRIPEIPTTAPETPTKAPAPDPTTTGTRIPGKTPTEEETNPVTDEPTDMAGPPANPRTILEIIETLSSPERDCLPPEVQNGRVSLALESVVGTDHARILKKVADCISDEDIVRLMVIPGLQEEITLNQVEKDCLTSDNSGAMVRKALETNGEFPAFTDALFIAVSGTFINIQDCLGEERSQELSVTLRCIIKDSQEAENLVSAIVDGNDEVLARIEERAKACARMFPPQYLIEPPECGREGVDLELPCRTP